MVNVQLKIRKPVAIETRHPKQGSSSGWLSKPVEMSAAVLGRFWWHTKAYATILRLVPLVLGSLAFLYLYWLGRKSLQASVKNVMEID